MPSLLELSLFLRKDRNQSKFTPYQVLALYAIVSINGIDNSWTINHTQLSEQLNISKRHLTDVLRPLIVCNLVKCSVQWRTKNYEINLTPDTYDFPQNGVIIGTPVRMTNFVTRTPVPMIEVSHANPSSGDKSYTLYIKEGDKEKEKNIYTQVQTKTENDAEEEKVVDEVTEVFQYWALLMNHSRAKLDDKRKKMIQKILKVGYTVEDLKAAIQGCAKSPWHMGQNDRNVVYDDIELILRDAKHVDAFIKNNDREIKADETRLTRSQKSIENGLDFLRTLKFVN